MSNRTELMTEGAKSLPAVTVTGATFMGLSLPDWAAVVTVIYVAFQIWLLLPKLRARNSEVWAKFKRKWKRK